MVPQLGAALHLCKMRLDTRKIAVHIVIYLESLFPAVLAANAVAVRQLLRLDQIDVRTTDSTLISHKFPPFSDNVGLFLALLAFA